jgi:YfiH family protein
MELLIPDWRDAPPNVGAFSTLRSGGFSRPPYDDGSGGGGFNLGTHVGDDLKHVEQNRRLLQSLLPAQPTWLTQVHGAAVLDIPCSMDAPEADASITDRPDAVCAILTADCLPVLFCDRRGSVVGAAHAGWRGLAGGVLENTVSRMRSKGADEILAWLGPAIGPERFEVGQEVMDAFAALHRDTASAFNKIEERPGKYLANIYQLARILLKRHGVENVYGGMACTVTDAGRYYSYRRDKITGRMATLIWLKS